MEYAVETFSLTKIFTDWWGRNKVCAVEELNLQIRTNEVFGLLGPNGSGKTTTLKLLLGLLHPTKGKALCLGGDSTDTRISAKIGFLPEESYLYRYLNARETLDFYGRLFGLDRQVRKMRIEALLDMVGLKGVANRPVGTYSKGMARRIGLAQALINDPDLLILDEPTTGLDPIGTRQIKDLILELAKRGKTILLCSHLLADVEDVCDRIAILYGGRIQAEGKVQDLLRQTDKREIMTGCISDTAIERIKQIVYEEHSECVVTSPIDRLETFFIRTVAAAREQAQPISGADSTTKISDFLTSRAGEEARRAEILDKLVSASMSQEKRKPTTEKVASIETSETRTDDELLSKLTGHDKQVETRSVGMAEEGKTEAAERGTSRQEQTKKDILDRLTGLSEADEDKNQQAPDDRGDSSDA